MSIVVKGGRLLDGVSDRPVEDSLISVREGRIVFAGPRASPAAPSSEADMVIDATGMTVLPGLVDPHVHLCFSAGENCLRDFWQDTENLHGGDDVLVLRAAQNAQRCLAAGVTTVADCGSRGRVALTIRDCVNRGLMLGPSIMASGPPITSTSGHLWYMGLEVDDETGILKAVRNLVKMGVDFIKVAVSGGFTDPFYTSPLGLQFSTEELKLLVEEAHRFKKLVAGHAYAAQSCTACIDAGVDRVDHCHWAVDVGKYKPDEAYLRLMAQRGLWAGFTIGDSRALLSVTRREAPSSEDSYSAVFRAMKRAGVLISIHSDAGCSNLRFEAFPLNVVAAAALLEMTPIEAVNTATHGNAKALGIDGEVGSVQAGKAADLVIIEGNPLENLLDLAKVKMVIRTGRVVAEDRNLVQPITILPRE